MVGASKILTVSYGTFSCTLEGFDEPFSTMKAIAEYFRDLAADDRYFGAEPPTPDAEMLHRIAEREVHRRVEAKINENGVILRQTEVAVQPPVAAPQPVEHPAAAIIPVAAVPVAEPAVIAEPAVTAPPVAETVPEAPEDIVAEDTVALVAAADEAAEEAESRQDDIEPASAEVAEVVAEDDVMPEFMEMAPVEMDADADEEIATAAETSVEIAADDVYEISLDAIMTDAAQTQVADTAEVDFILDDAADAAEVAEEPEADSIAAKLMRIRAVVAGVRSNNAAVYEDDDAPDLEPGSAAMADDFAFALDLSGDVPELRAAEAARAEARSAEQDMAEQDVDAVNEEEPAAEEPATAELAAEELIDMEAAYDEAVDEESIEEHITAETADDVEILANLSTLRLRMAEDAAHESLDDRAEAPQTVAEASAEEPEDAHAADEDLDDTQSTAADAGHPSLYQRARARVIRLSKVATLRSTDADDTDAEAHIEAQADTLDHDIDGKDDKPAPEAGEGRAILEATHSDSDADVTRLMDEAKEKLEGAETRRRFSAISHLKAAVAATLADRQMHTSETPTEVAAAEEDEISLYREDLSKAVRPRRPAAEPAGMTRRPSMDMRPAPLVLVSEQRVDRPDATRETTVVRPRRIASGNLAVYALDDEDEDMIDLSPESASSFAEFAERLGATTLTEMLEAAAAYTASVEGQPHFSRPQILRKVEFVAEDGDFSREDGLRSFGMLLRQGKIQKISRGQFTIAGSSKFMSDTRRAH